MRSRTPGGKSETGEVRGQQPDSEPGHPVLSVVVPVYNERVTIREILQRIVATPFPKEIIVVDDGSSDGTGDVLREIERDWPRALEIDDPDAVSRTAIRLHIQPDNQGKGAALAAGFAYVTGDIVVIQDADLEYDPQDYSTLLEPILSGVADVVYGSRFAGGRHRVLFFWHLVGNRVLTLLSNLTTNLVVTDMETGYKAFSAQLLKRFKIRSKRFGVEPEITAKFARMKVRIWEVPISYHGRTYEAGKKAGWKDGVAAIWTILKYAWVDDVDNALPGYTTLQRMRRLRAYNRWMWGKIEPHVGDSVLEVGSGTGNITQFIQSRLHVTATDVDPRYLEMLRTFFDAYPSVEVQRMDLSQDPTPEVASTDYDTVICLNVLEHVEDDVAALRRLHGLLHPGGRLLLVVPALAALYGSIDAALGHHRRYDEQVLRERLAKAGFDVDHTAYFNCIGIAGWWLNSVILRRKTVPGLQARVNSWLTPLLKLEDRFRLRWGMSLLAVATRTDP